MGPSNLFESIQSRLLFSVDLSWDHFLLLALIHSKQIWLAGRMNAYFIKKGPYCKNYRTVVVETAHIPILRLLFRPSSLALWHIFYSYSKKCYKCLLDFCIFYLQRNQTDCPNDVSSRHEDNLTGTALKNYINMFI